MSHVTQNLRFLRKQKGLTQGELAKKLEVTRSVIGAYEEGRAEPKLNTLRKIANFFGISIDQLVNEDLSRIAEASIKGEELPRQRTDATGRRLRILSITVDPEGRENIELVPEKAAAGYLNGYADPEYLEELPRFQLPTLPQGSYRAFEITGDSMLPLKPGTVIIGEYMDNWKTIKDGETAILVTNTEGIVYKRVYNRIEEQNRLILHSDNPVYPPYEVLIEDVMEIWKAKAFISMDFPENDFTLEKLANIVIELQQEVIKLKNK